MLLRLLTGITLLTSILAVSPGGDLSNAFVHHFSADRPGTDTVLQTTIQSLYPNTTVTVTQDWQFDLLGFSRQGYVSLEKMNDISPIERALFIAPKRRRDGDGTIITRSVLGGYHVEWQGESLIAIVASWQEGFQVITQWHLISDSSNTGKNLIHACAFYTTTVKEAIMVFEQSFWKANHDLWLSVQKASWDDVILDEGMKKALRGDITSFFKSEKIYKGLGIGWKRGLIFLGPPGNGKTVSLKAIMKEATVPILYVKSFHSYGGDELGMQMVFERARAQAPCVLVMEDLDSLITDQNRSFFLNEVDGIDDNDGIYLIGTTNHFERLDPALSSRPSRFDRKYVFPNPSKAERRQYAVYWQHKLAGNGDIDFPSKLLDEIAEKTKGFSFSYIQEAFVSTLVLLAGQETPPQKTEFRTIMFQQISALRAELEREKGKPNSLSSALMGSSGGRSGLLQQIGNADGNLRGQWEGHVARGIARGVPQYGI